MVLSSLKEHKSLVQNEDGVQETNQFRGLCWEFCPDISHLEKTI